MTDRPSSSTLDISAARATDTIVAWLVRLRWAALSSLLVGGWAAYFFWGAKLPLGILSVLLLLLVGTNVAIGALLKASPRAGTLIGILLLAEIAIFTGILYVAGGPTNPFGLIYLVGVTTAAVALGSTWAMGTAAASTVAYGLLFLEARPLDFVDPVFGVYMFQLHLWGMWAVVASGAGIIAYFVSRMSAELATRERELALARAETARSERLAALFSLGAGAAHELATPLSTIQTAAGELERELAASALMLDPQCANYVRAILREVDRCTNVLDHLSGRASSASASEPSIGWAGFVDDLRYRLGDPLSRRLDIDVPEAEGQLPAPTEPLLQTLVALIRNAFDASTSEQRVALTIRDGARLHIAVVDHGMGMDAEAAARAGEPFFTTKSAGGGLGLGLFLAHSFAAQMGGTLTLRSTPGAGTSVILDLPGMP